MLEPNPVRNFLDDPRRRSGPLEEPERDRREGSRRHGRNWGGPDFERVRYGLEQERQVGVGGWATTAAQQPVSGFHGEGCVSNAGLRAGSYPPVDGCPRAILPSFCSFMICFGVVFLLTNVSGVYWVPAEGQALFRVLGLNQWPCNKMSDNAECWGRRLQPSQVRARRTEKDLGWPL